MSDFLQFAEEDKAVLEQPQLSQKWKVLIVDDEADIHRITELVMDDFTFQGRKIAFLNAYSAEEAKSVIKETSDIAVILLDVVMETQSAGLDLVKFIRMDMNNKLTRIILRTGQPGKAPEKDVIFNYDINDYKHKTELTKSKLDTTLITAIRAYRDLMVLNKSRIGLTRIIEASNDIFEMKSLNKFIEGILIQLTSLLKLDDATMYLEASSVALDDENHFFTIIAGTGKYASLRSRELKDCVSKEIFDLITRSFRNKESFFEDNYYIGYFRSGQNRENILLLEGFSEIETTDKYLIELFSRNINIAFKKNYTNQESIDTRDEILFRLGEISERHHPGNTHHVQRVGEIAFRLAELTGMNHSQAEEVKIAAAMHDVGKILLDDDILEKETALSDEELETMRYHTETGEIILRNNRFQLLENAALVAAQHHERWDGSGYPNKLKGEEISLTARIASLALIYDALNHEQPYRKAWNQDDILDFIKANSGRMFDPDLVKLFFNHYSLINEVNRIYPQ